MREAIRKIVLAARPPTHSWGTPQLTSEDSATDKLVVEHTKEYQNTLQICAHCSHGFGCFDVLKIVLQVMSLKLATMALTGPQIEHALAGGNLSQATVQNYSTANSAMSDVSTTDLVHLTGGQP